ncbi:MAG: transglycosylase SLT domain-containing protein [Pseudomonadota bacterium]|nr:transglycosylase SLT domain-containing protein [Pseudomonadota bacterium]
MKILSIIAALVILLLILWPEISGAVPGEDPWAQLRRTFPVVKNPRLSQKIEKKEIKQKKGIKQKKTKREEFAGEDPWQHLRHIIIPFKIEAERIVVEDEEPKETITAPVKSHKVITSSVKEEEKVILPIKRKDMIISPIKKRMAPWRREIDNAAALFQVPTAIIEAVIMVESGGDPRAKAKTSSASGLMQTIKATFSEARRALAEQGVTIPDNPFDPYASIMAGSWYLGKMFEQAEADGKAGVKLRSELASWRYPLEYYYAGPGHGRKAEPRVLIYSGGKRLLIDKPAYSRKVLTWASKLG